MSATFVLLHGAFRGAWSWTRVRPELASRGHVAFAPTLLGAGERWNEDTGPVGLGEVVEDLRRWAWYEDLSDVVLVGHSQGGLVARAATTALADRLRLVAFLDAPVPDDGEAAIDLVPSATAGKTWPRPERDTRIDPWPVTPSDGISAADAAWMTERLTPEWAALGLDPVRLDDAARAVPTAHAFCADTPPAFPAVATRERMDAAGQSYDLLATGHDAPMSAPDLVADWLDGLVA